VCVLMYSSHYKIYLFLQLLIVVCINCFFFSFSFAWPSVVLPAPSPRQFFPRSSPVVDFPYGDVAGVMSLLDDGSEECIFVMYYAPWCGRSVRARTEFDKAARYLEDEVSSHTQHDCFSFFTSGTCISTN